MLKLNSKFLFGRLGVFVALAIFSQVSLGQEPTPLPPLPDPELSSKPIPKKSTSKDSHSDSASSSDESSSRYQDRYPKFSTVLTAFTNWSKQDNSGVIGQISSDKWEKMAKWMNKVIDYRGTLDTDACSSKDASSAELRSALNFCFGAADGETTAAVYRLVLALKEETTDAEEIRGALREIDLCKSALKKMADGKRKKLGDRANRSPMDWELDLDNIQPLLGNLAKLKVETSASPSPSPWVKPSNRTRAEECIIYHRDCYQQRLDETPLDKMCLLGEKIAEPVAARTTPTPPKDNALPPPVQPTPGQPAPYQPAPMQQVPQPQPVPQVAPPSYQPTPNYPATPPMAGGYVGGGYKKGGGGCGGCGGGGGGGFVAAPVVRGPVGVSVGVGVGPRYPYPAPLPYPPMGYPMPMQGPLMMGGGAVVGGGGPGPSVGSVAVVSKTTIVTNAPMANQMPMFPPKTCQKCPPGMRGPQINPLMRPGYPQPQRPGFLVTQRPPSVTPYPGQPGVTPYPGQPGVTPYFPGQPNVNPYMPPTTGGQYGPITTTPYQPTQPISPYVNPTFYGQTQTQYGPITPDRGGVGRVALKNS